MWGKKLTFHLPDREEDEPDLTKPQRRFIMDLIQRVDGEVNPSHIHELGKYQASFVIDQLKEKAREQESEAWRNKDDNHSSEDDGDGSGCGCLIIGILLLLAVLYGFG